MNKVLVHCQMGRSRSATMVAMYLLYKHLVDVCGEEEIDANMVVEFLKQRRNVVDPNTGFVNQIYEFEGLCHNGEIKKKV